MISAALATRTSHRRSRWGNSLSTWGTRAYSCWTCRRHRGNHRSGSGKPAAQARAHGEPKRASSRLMHPPARWIERPRTPVRIAAFDFLYARWLPTLVFALAALAGGHTQHERSLIGKWRKATVSICAQSYPDEVEFLEATYRAKKGLNQRFIVWDAGGYYVTHPGRV